MSTEEVRPFWCRSKYRHREDQVTNHATEQAARDQAERNADHGGAFHSTITRDGDLVAYIPH